MNLQPHGPKPCALPSCATFRYGALEGIRTPDLLVRSQMLYPAELRAHTIERRHLIYINGGSGQDRTADTEIFSLVLYRLSYRAKNMAVPTGLEPAIFCVTGRRVNHYTTEPKILKMLFKYTKFFTKLSILLLKVLIFLFFFTHFVCQTKCRYHYYN